MTGRENELTSFFLLVDVLDFSFLLMVSIQIFFSPGFVL